MINRLGEESRILTKSSDVVENSMEDTNEHVSDILISTEKFEKSEKEILQNVEQLTKSSKSILQFAGSISAYAQDGKEFVDHINQESREMQEKIDVNRVNSEENIKRITAELAVLIENSKSAAKIGKLTLEISNIAKTPQILSFNASIEAQRAGNEGRGFCVIADEIRKLSEESNQMAKRIDQVVAVVLKAVNDMSAKSEEVLCFMNENIISDYQNFDVIIEKNVKSAEDIAGIMNHFTKHAASLEEEISGSTTGLEQINRYITNNTEELTCISDNIKSLLGEMQQMKAEAEITGESAIRLKKEIAEYIH